MATLKLTKSIIDSLPLTAAGQRVYMDTELKGFGVVVGRTSKTFIAQKDIMGRTRRVSIGKMGTWTPDEARREARDLLVDMDKGKDPMAIKREEKAREITLKEACAVHVERLKRQERAEGTIADYDYYLGAMFKDWLNRSIQSFNRSEVRERHTRLVAKHGPYSGNKAMKCLRAIFNTMLKEHDGLQVNPTIAVNWCKERRRQEPVAPDKLEDWYAKVQTIINPVRRDLQLFTLFTGLRRADVASIRWADLDLKKGSLHRPLPKGGASRSFTIPLPDVCLEILKQRKQGNGPWFGADCPWVFPTFNKAGEVTHVVMPYEDRLGLPTPHRLRDTYTTAANAAGLSPYDIDVLTNHRPPQGSVTSGYIRQDFAHLQTQQQRVADYLKTKIGMKA